MNKLFLMLCIASAIMVNMACNNASEQKEENTTEQTPAATNESSGIQTAEIYECPMKCEGKQFDKAGKCPVCGMDLVKVEKSTEATTDTASHTH